MTPQRPVQGALPSPPRAESVRTISVLSVAAQLVATIGAGLLAEVVGLRAPAFLAPIVGVLAAAILWWSRVRSLVTLAVMDRRSPIEAAVDVERDQPVGA